MGQTRVDLHHLLEDLRDAYPGALEETILTEIVANSLDSDARRISLRSEPSESVLVVVDDGRGMSRRELSRFHDVAASSKRRGEGIGFAGVGIKLGLLACSEVLTETHRGGKRVATRWRLASRHRAPWHWVDPPGFLDAQGTAVCLRLKNALSPLLDSGFLEAVLRQHFEPLLDSRFDAVLAARYPDGIELVVNGRELDKSDSTPGAAIDVVLPRKRKPCGRGVLIRSADPLPENEAGIAVSTLGKVIRRGWDWLGLTPLAPRLVGGLVEVPSLSESLTLNKADFLRSGPRGLYYLSVRKAIQQAVMAQLEAWGEGRDPEEEARRRAARPLERDLEQVLVHLAEDFPALAPLVEQRAGGQKLLPVGGRGGAQDGGDAAEAAGSDVGGPNAAPEGVPAEEAAPGAPATGPADGRNPPDQPAEGPEPGGGGRKAPRRYRLSIEFEERPDLPGLARLIESTVRINTAHPAQRRAVASRAEGYHAALGVALALSTEVSDAQRAPEFINAFLTHWGEALGRDLRRRGAKKSR